ncbi:hypothetical protein PIB30_100663 [Stylosanthes scabra]|uniref:Uncharacterized protein n=1 Tax=Stylosanthes scabra TaxID=79078 RepID=A0ABU6QYP1_9FABA|nr:hypothetical protein [Stylosanthes scabra]
MLRLCVLYGIPNHVYQVLKNPQTIRLGGLFAIRSFFGLPSSLYFLVEMLEGYLHRKMEKGCWRCLGDMVVYYVEVGNAGFGNFWVDWWCKVGGTEVVVAVDWSSICFAGYLATLEVVLDIVCLVGHCLSVIEVVRRCNNIVL